MVQINALFTDGWTWSSLKISPPISPPDYLQFNAFYCIIQKEKTTDNQMFSVVFFILLFYLAERGGFEPPVHCKADNGFRDRRIRPLCHLSRSMKKKVIDPSLFGSGERS